MSRALEWVTNGRAAAPPACVCMGVSTSRNPRRSNADRTARHARSSGSARCRGRRAARSGRTQRSTDPGLLVHLPVRHRQRPQRLGRHPPGITQHRQLAAPGAHHLTVHEYDVAEVDVGLQEPPAPQARPPPPGSSSPGARCRHRPAAWRVQLAGVTGEHDAAGDADDVPGPVSGARSGGSRMASVCVRGTDTGQGLMAPASRRSRLLAGSRTCSARSASLTSRQPNRGGRGNRVAPEPAGGAGCRARAESRGAAARRGTARTLGEAGSALGALVAVAFEHQRLSPSSVRCFSNPAGSAVRQQQRRGAATTPPPRRRRPLRPLPVLRIRRTTPSTRPAKPQHRRRHLLHSTVFLLITDRGRGHLDPAQRGPSRGRRVGCHLDTGSDGPAQELPPWRTRRPR